MLTKSTTTSPMAQPQCGNVNMVAEQVQAGSSKFRTVGAELDHEDEVSPSNPAESEQLKQKEQLELQFRSTAR